MALAIDSVRRQELRQSRSNIHLSYPSAKGHFKIARGIKSRFFWWKPQRGSANSLPPLGLAPAGY